MQVEIEQSTKTLTDLESETASARNQLTSLDAQKMKLVQEGNHKTFVKPWRLGYIQRSNCVHMIENIILAMSHSHECPGLLSNLLADEPRRNLRRIARHMH